MTLEQRLIDALHRADDFDPSPDLFARVERSLEEDRRHRRRVIAIGTGVFAGALAAALLLRATSSISDSGQLVVPGWAFEMVITAIKIALILALGPSLRRLGQPLIADVFRLDPATGRRFLSLLNIAFYLFLSGLILLDAHPQGWNRVFAADDWWLWRDSIAVFLLMMGIAHATNIAALPLIGLFNSSLVRRARRQEAGAGAPAVSTRAEQAERVVRFIVWGIAGLALLAVVAGVGAFVVLGVLRT